MYNKAAHVCSFMSLSAIFGKNPAWDKCARKQICAHEYKYIYIYQYSPVFKVIWVYLFECRAFTLMTKNQ